ncbi:hypothetical protein ACHAXR_008902 [Thalassiosira sp. AJA248-18]
MDFYFLMLTFAMSALPAAAAYSNITLESPIMSVKIFTPMLPKGRAEDSADDDKYYVSSRFEHGSMIGDVVFEGDRGVYGQGALEDASRLWLARKWGRIGFRALQSPDPNEITFVSKEKLGDFGYRIQKTARVDGSVLTVRSLLTNLGKKQFTTPWYSHHFFTGDHEPVGPGYKLDLGVSKYGRQTPTPQFKQPGLGAWLG